MAGGIDFFCPAFAGLEGFVDMIVTAKKQRRAAAGAERYVSPQCKRGRSGQTREEFLSIAAQELCAPVGAIQGFAEMMLNGNVQEAQQREFLEIIAQKMALLSSIMRDMVDLGRLESRRGKDFVLVPTDLGNLLQEWLGVFAGPGDLCAPVLRLPAKPIFILADRNRVMQALAKALDHVYQGALPGAKVRIALKSQRAGEAGEDGTRRIGIHIAIQGSGANKSEARPIGAYGGGTWAPKDASKLGLAMSVVAEIVELHGGEVLAQSKAGHGRVITLLFPECQRAERARWAQGALGENCKSPRRPGEVLPRTARVAP